MKRHRAPTRICAAAALAFIFMAGEAHAADVCPGPGVQTESAVAAMQQELMVAALYCNASARYNQFVLAYRTALRRSDAKLRYYFRHDDPRTGMAAYNAFKTKLANVASLRSIRDQRAYCLAAEGIFDAARGPHISPLVELAAKQPAVLSVATEICAR